MSHFANKGFILLMVLFLLQIMTFMTLYLLNAGLLIYQSGQKYWKSYQLFVNTENILNQIMQFDENNYCLLSPILTENLRSKSIEWWENNTCCADNYCYVVELLASNICMRDQGKDIPIKYLRYTLFSFNQQKHHREWLQSVVIKLDNASQQCVEVDPEVSLGPQSWRRL